MNKTKGNFISIFPLIKNHILNDMWCGTSLRSPGFKIEVLLVKTDFFASGFPSTLTYFHQILFLADTLKDFSNL